MLRTVRRPSFLILSLIGCLFAPQAHAKTKIHWPVPPLSSFDGARLGDLEIGRTTPRWIKERYGTETGAYPRSTELSQPKNTPLRVDVLWQKLGDADVVSAITVRFAGDGAGWSDVEKLFSVENVTPQSGYQRGRFEDWRVAYWPSRGVAAFVMREGETDFVPLLMFTAPNNLAALQRRLTSQAAPIEIPFDPHENEPKVMEFGTINIDLDDDLELSAREEYRIRDDIRDAYAGGTLRYRRSGSGTYKVKMSGSKKATGGSVSVSVSIKGDGPYGPLTASGSGYDSWKWKSLADYDKNDVVDAFRDALRDARREAEDKFERAMRNSGPPTLEQIRADQWARLIEAVRESAPLATLSLQFLR